MTTPDDDRLVSRLQTGCYDAHADLIRDHYQGVYRFLFHMTHDVHRAEDLTQETFIAAWERIATFEGRSSVKTWLHRIAYTRLIDGHRAVQRDTRLRANVAVTEFAHSDPVQTAIDTDDQQRLHRALDELDAVNRTVLVLHYLQGLSYREMALVLGEPDGTVKWRTREALNCLRHLLGEDVSNDATSKFVERGRVS